MFIIIGAMAQLERDIIRERVKADLSGPRPEGFAWGARIGGRGWLVTLRAGASQSGRWPGGFIAVQPFMSSQLWPTSRPTQDREACASPATGTGPLLGCGAQCRGRPWTAAPDLQSRPLVASGWCSWLSCSRQRRSGFADRGGIE
jgi:hypothetical protein